MRHYRHVPRHSHQRAAARRCRTHRAEHVGTSRIAPLPIREARGCEAAGQGTSRAVSKDPDCWGRLVLILLRLIGGGRR